MSLHGKSGNFMICYIIPSGAGAPSVSKQMLNRIPTLKKKKRRKGEWRDSILTTGLCGMRMEAMKTNYLF